MNVTGISKDASDRVSDSLQYGFDFFIHSPFAKSEHIA
jgi:hypothetical protein